LRGSGGGTKQRRAGGNGSVDNGQAAAPVHNEVPPLSISLPLRASNAFILQSEKHPDYHPNWGWRTCTDSWKLPRGQ
jgi:hypothetical protein